MRFSTAARATTTTTATTTPRYSSSSSSRRPRPLGDQRKTPVLDPAKARRDKPAGHCILPRGSAALRWAPPCLTVVSPCPTEVRGSLGRVPGRRSSPVRRMRGPRPTFSLSFCAPSGRCRAEDRRRGYRRTFVAVTGSLILRGPDCLLDPHRSKWFECVERALSCVDVPQS